LHNVLVLGNSIHTVLNDCKITGIEDDVISLRHYSIISVGEISR